jgi:acetylornithine deacetylase/succinyl-diaminopimelate desuccinylase-like protein
MTHPAFEGAAAFITTDLVRDTLIDLVNIPSPTGQELGIAKYLVDRMRAAGLDVDLPLVEASRPNAVGHLRGRGDGNNLLFTGHMDTAYGDEEELPEGEGFRPRAAVRDGWLFGLGANNMKAGLAAALVAIEAIAKSGARLAGDISFGAVVGEIEKTAIEEFQGLEYSGHGIGSKHLVTHGVTADYAILCEPTGLRTAIANMGCIWLRVTLEGTLSHSALASRPGIVNAIAIMHELQADIAAWAKDYENRHDFMGEHPNVTLAAIRGGAPWRLSRTPPSCSLYLDIRTVPGQSIDTVKRDLRRLLRWFAERTRVPEPGIYVYITDPPVALDPGLPVVDALGKAQALVLGETTPLFMRRPGADAVHLTAYGVPCLGCGPGGRLHPDAREASMHAFGEHVLIDDVVAAARIYVATALDLCNRKAGMAEPWSI